MKTQKTLNLRTHKRMKAHYLIKYQTAESDGEPLVANIQNMSAGGIRFWSEVYIPEGSSVKFSIWIPPLDFILEGLADVVRVRQSKNRLVYYLAAKFSEIPSEDQDALNEFIETA